MVRFLTENLFYVNLEIGKSRVRESTQMVRLKVWHHRKKNLSTSLLKKGAFRKMANFKPWISIPNQFQKGLGDFT